MSNRRVQNSEWRANNLNEIRSIVFMCLQALDASGDVYKYQDSIASVELPIMYTQLRSLW